MTKNEHILIETIVITATTGYNYIESDFVVFPNNVTGYLKKSFTYLKKAVSQYGKIEYDEKIRKIAFNRIANQSLKLPTDKKFLIIPEQDFDYITVLLLSSMQFDEILERQKLPVTVKTNLKTANTYLKKFFEFIQKELGE